MAERSKVIKSTYHAQILMTIVWDTFFKLWKLFLFLFFKFIFFFLFVFSFSLNYFFLIFTMLLIFYPFFFSVIPPLFNHTKSHIILLSHHDTNVETFTYFRRLPNETIVKSCLIDHHSFAANTLVKPGDKGRASPANPWFYRFTLFKAWGLRPEAQSKKGTPMFVDVCRCSSNISQFQSQWTDVWLGSTWTC